VRRVEANPVTGNVLLTYDPTVSSGDALMRGIGQVRVHPDAPVDRAREAPPAMTERRHGPRRRARIAVRGLDRDPDLSRRVLQRLRRHAGVTARASPLTGRVLVEFDEKLTSLQDLLATVSDIELPELPGEDRPTHPLDPAPLIQSSARTVGAAVGLGWQALRRVGGLEVPPETARVFATASGVIGILQGFPFVRNGLRRLLGRDAADLTVNLTNIAMASFTSSPLGLLAMGAESLVLLNEVVARRAAWRRYEERLGDAAAEPGATVCLEAGDRVPLDACVLEGHGTALGEDGLPVPLSPGERVPAGARIAGGPIVLELTAGEGFTPAPRPAPPQPDLYRRYLQALGPAALAYAGLTALLTRSFSRTLASLVLVNPRTAVIGTEAATLDAVGRLCRSGLTQVSVRPDRPVQLPDVLLLDGVRLLTRGLDVSAVVPLREGSEPADMLELAAAVAAGANAPWGSNLSRHSPGSRTVADGRFDGVTASATVDGARYTLGPRGARQAVPDAERLGYGGQHLLVLRRQADPEPFALVALRPGLAEGVETLVERCRRHGVELRVMPHGNHAAVQAVAHRAKIKVARSPDAVGLIRRMQAGGSVVAYASDRAVSGPAFAAADLGIGMTSGRGGSFPARADLLAPDVAALAAFVEAAARRDAAARDAVALSAIANVAGAAWGVRGRPGVQRAGMAGYITGLAALLDGTLRLRGGEPRRGHALVHLADPQPERWGRRSIDATLHALRATAQGLSDAEAAARQRHAPRAARRHEWLAGVRDQVRSPISLVLAGGAALAVGVGQALDGAIIALTLGVNVAAGVWQERQAGEAAEALKRLATTTARVMREGRAMVIPAANVVSGDVLLLAPGDRVAADARLLQAAALEVDEAALTGESFPVAKGPDELTDAARVVLEGSDVLVGSGRAVVVAIGRNTRMGAIAEALKTPGLERSPLNDRLAQVLRLALPLAVGGGALAIGFGLLRGQPMVPQLTLGLTTALSVIPEGLPLLAGTGQAGVARRLATRHALVRRLSGIEALGRVDVACADKTGTLTEGKLSLRVVADADREAELPGRLGAGLRHVLLTAALASPHPESVGAAAHPTDRAVLKAAESAGLAQAARRPREAEAPFDPARSFHAALVQGRLCMKGAPEAVIARCDRVRRLGGDEPADGAARRALLDRAQSLAARGLRVLAVAERAPEADAAAPSVQEPVGLVALGFLGIRDSLRPGVPTAVRRCRAAGVRVLMLTGDHRASATAVAREAGILDAGESDDRAVVTARELAELDNGELDRRMEAALVIARATPLDKLKIIESLRRGRHVIAMTGDGVNDAPALRLADVGVAMGRAGTDVARQAADLVLTDDNFATLVDALVEGRGFWRNMRRAMSLLLGGNLGEVGLVVGASLLGTGSPLNTRQILIVNLITDALPALAVVLQRPEHQNLSALAREGASALDASLRTDVLHRGSTTGLPALGAFLAMRRLGLGPQANSVAFASIVATQLAQTLDAGRVEGALSRSVVGAVGASAGLMAATLVIPPLRNMLAMSALGPTGWGMIGASALASVLLSRAACLPGTLSAAPTPGRGAGGNGQATQTGSGPAIQPEASRGRYGDAANA
jgi:cation-transporting P-type ATPase I